MVRFRPKDPAMVVLMESLVRDLIMVNLVGSLVTDLLTLAILEGAPATDPQTMATLGESPATDPQTMVTLGESPATDLLMAAPTDFQMDLIMATNSDLAFIGLAMAFAGLDLA